MKKHHLKSFVGEVHVPVVMVTGLCSLLSETAGEPVAYIEKRCQPVSIHIAWLLVVHTDWPLVVLEKVQLGFATCDETACVVLVGVASYVDVDCEVTALLSSPPGLSSTRSTAASVEKLEPGSRP